MAAIRPSQLGTRWLGPSDNFPNRPVPGDAGSAAEVSVLVDVRVRRQKPKRHHPLHNVLEARREQQLSLDVRERAMQSEAVHQLAVIVRVVE